MKTESFDNCHVMKVVTDVLLYTVRNENQKNLRKLPEKKLQLLMIKRKGEPHKD